MVERIGINSNNEGILRSVENSRMKTAISLAKIASGTRLASAGEDPAGAAIAAALRSDITALKQATQNTQAGANLLNTAEGGLSTISDLLARGRELAIQASNGTLGQAERDTINREFNAVRAEIDRISGSTEFNGQKLLNGELGANSPNQVNVQVGANAGAENQINLNVVENSNSQSLGIDNLDLSTAQGALQALDPLAKAQQQVTNARGEIGATTNRLSATSRNLSVAVENLSQSENSIAGTDIAEEITNLRQSLTQTELSLSTLMQKNRQHESVVGRLLNTSA